MGTRLAVATRNAACDAMVDRIDVGSGTSTIKVYTGSQPATPDTAASGTLLVTFNLANPVYGAAATGVATLLNTPVNSTGAAAGDAGWFRVLDRDGNPVFDGVATATGGGGQLELNTVTISIGVNVQITAGSFTMPLGS